MPFFTQTTYIPCLSKICFDYIKLFIKIPKTYYLYCFTLLKQAAGKRKQGKNNETENEDKCVATVMQENCGLSRDTAKICFIHNMGD